MELDTIYMRRSAYGANKGLVSGEIEFTGNAGKVSLKLTPEHCAAILKIVAAQLVEQSKELATSLTADIIESSSTPLLSKE